MTSSASQAIGQFPTAAERHETDPTAAPAGAWSADGAGPGRLGTGDGRTRSRPADPVPAAALGLADSVAFAAAGLAGVALLAAAPAPLVLVSAVAVALNASAGLYPGYRLLPHERLRRRALNTCRVAVVAALGVAAVSGDARQGGAVLVVVLLAGILQIPLGRVARSVLRRSGRWGERASIVAGANRAALLRDFLAEHWEYGIVPADARDGPEGGQPRLAVIADGAVPTGEELARLRADHDEVVLLADLPGLPISGLRPADMGGEIALRVAGRPRPRLDAIRRILDLAIAVPASLVALPVVATAAAAVYAIDPGPVFYTQLREGLNGTRFPVLKLRTMYRDAERRLETLLAADRGARIEWATHFKLRNDPRILPRVGAFLRSSSIDELPQLWNVLSGDMRIVGPRPFPEYQLEAMGAEFRARRASVVPGLTGLWQISERSEADVERQRNLDGFYIDNNSLWFDLHIIVQTFAAVARRSGV